MVQHTAFMGYKTLTWYYTPTKPKDMKKIEIGLLQQYFAKCQYSREDIGHQ